MSCTMLLFRINIGSRKWGNYRRYCSSMSAPVFVHPCTYFADLVVENKVIIEVKAVSALSSVHNAKLINYLHISGLKLGYLVNFGGIKVYWKRLVL